MTPRVWTVGDSEPEDHPVVVAGDSSADPDLNLEGPFVYRWEPPNTENGNYGGWWLDSYLGDGGLYSWEDVLREEGLVTEVIEDVSDS